MDELDLEILHILQREGYVSKAEIGRRINLAPSAVASRLERLEGTDVILGFQVILNHEKLGLDLLAFVFVTDNKTSSSDEVMKALRGLKISDEVHRVTGDDCYILKVRASNTTDLREKLDLLNELPMIATVRSHISLQSFNTSADVEHSWRTVAR